MRSILAALLALALAVPAAAGAAEKEKSKAQEPEKPRAPRLSKQPLGACGVSIYAPEGYKVDPPERSPDGAEVYTSDLGIGAHHFGSICVKFTEGMPTDGEQLEATLVSYMDYLKGTLKIKESVGYGRGHRIEKVPAARGVIDYWKDEDGDDWKVKGWVTPSHITVLFVYGKGDYPYMTVQEMFLDGFREE